MNQQVHKPRFSTEAAPFWDGLARQALMLQHCSACSEAVFPPRPFCPYCLSRDVTWRESEGRGSLYTFSEHFIAPSVGYETKVPYVLGFVHMNEGAFLFGEIVEPAGELRIDMPMQAITITHSDQELLGFKAAL